VREKKIEKRKRAKGWRFAISYLVSESFYTILMDKNHSFYSLYKEQLLFRFSGKKNTV
jgi:hypothetical protein